MNKMRVIAKVSITLLGVYFLVFALLQCVSYFNIVLSVIKGDTSILSVVISLVISLLMMVLYISAVCYFLIYRADKFARKIVKEETELPELSNPFAWYPFSLRLVVIIAGFLFLQKSISLFSRLAHFFLYTFRSDMPGSKWQMYEYEIFLVIYLAISIYLLCGAPQFVRWHVKRTKRLYGDVWK